MPDNDNEFRELLALALDGSEEAARELVARYGDGLRRAVRRCLNRRLRSLFDSADFAQMVWLSVFRHREVVERLDRPADFVKFLVGMAKKKIACETRRRLVSARHNLNREQSSETLIADAQRTPDCGIAAIESLACQEQFEEFLAELPESNRQIVELRLNGHKKTEIAQRLDIPERTLRRIWSKLLSSWRKFFKAEQ